MSDVNLKERQILNNCIDFILNQFMYLSHCFTLNHKCTFYATMKINMLTRSGLNSVPPTLQSPSRTCKYDRILKARYNFCRCNKLRSKCIIAEPKSNDPCLCKKTQTHTEGRQPCEDRSRKWRNPAMSQGMPRIAGKHQRLGRHKEGCFPRVFRGNVILPIPPWF